MTKTSVPIRRKFLLASPPHKMAGGRGIEIEQGYVVRERGQELRIRREGRRYYLSARDRRGRSVTGQEIRITKGHFEKLWPFTLGQRITRIRHLGKLGRLRMKIDEFTGEHSPLRLGEVFFPDAAASRAFNPLPWNRRIPRSLPKRAMANRSNPVRTKSREPVRALCRKISTLLCWMMW